MTERVSALIDRFEKVNDELIGVVEGLSNEQWSALTATEKWSVGVVAHHVAEDHAVLAGLAKAVATGQARAPLTFELLDQLNARHAQEHAHCTKGETVDLLRRNGVVATGTVRDLNDQQLDNAAPVFAGAPNITAQRLIEDLLIGHVAEHLASIRRATAA